MRRRGHPVRWPAPLVAAMAGGCVTYMGDDLAAVQLRHQEDLRQIQEQIRMVHGRVEALEMEAQRLAGEMEAVRRLAASASDGALRAGQARLQELENRLSRLDAARESDRQAIVDELSRRVADLLKRSTPAPTQAARPAARRPTASGATTGYEHVVQPGETLSAIAAAYGVSVSVIAQENGIADPLKLRAGQKLFIPEKR